MFCFDVDVEYVTFDDYQKIDIEEMYRGKQSNKPREKIVSPTEMLEIAHKKVETKEKSDASGTK